KMALGMEMDRLDQHLHLGRQVLTQLLHNLNAAGLAESDGAGIFVLTALGHTAFASGLYSYVPLERRLFCFFAGETPELPPLFLNLRDPVLLPWPVASDWSFDPDILRSCVRQPKEWKEQNGFPPDIEEICLQSAEGGTGEVLSDWQSVVLAGAARWFGLLVWTEESAPGRLLGFGIRQDGWMLDAAKPVFDLKAGWQEVVLEATHDVPLEQWQRPWQTWCQQRGLADSRSEMFPLERAGHRLRVFAPWRFIERLKQARSDALKGDAWVLAGDGRIRAAAVIEIVEAGAAQRPGINLDSR